ncbi:M48 family metalloprotease [Candidatus Woesearchaeota archaeon]|nr:M48 family metalloprotease [Candidatus Woesearchaeota archaeon]
MLHEILRLTETFLNSPFKMYISLLSVLFAITTFVLIKRVQKNRFKVLFIYLHLFFLILPPFMFAFSLGCDMNVLSGLISNCAIKVTETVIYTGIGAIILSVLIGYFVMPKLFSSKNTKKLKEKTILRFVNKEAKKLGIKTPKVFLIDDAKPDAFSYSTISSSIFISVGMIELLSKKELEAVLLHEFYHVHNRSSLYKFSTLILRIFSPLSRFASFNKDLDDEEAAADNFAIEKQCTNKNILNAKKKINLFFSSC